MVMTTLILAASALVLVPLVAWAHHTNKKRLAAWRQVAGRLGLTYSKEGWWAKAKVEGDTTNGHTVVLDTYTVSTGKSSTTYTRIRVHITDPLPSLVLRPEGMGTALGRLIGSDDVTTEDPGFDDSVFVRSEDTEGLTAVLDSKARGLLRRCVDERFSVKDGSVQYQVGKVLRDADAIEALLRKGIAIADLTQRPEDPVERLAKIATTDPVAGVRRRAVSTLRQGLGADSDPDAEVRTRALESAARDPDASVRVEAALGLGAIEVLADLVADHHVTPPNRIKALRGLVDLAAVEQDTLLPLLQDQPPTVTAAAVRVAGEIGAAKCLPVVLGLITSPDRAVVTAACTALGLLGGPEHEGALFDVADSGTPKARLAAVNTLGRLGTLASIPRLEPMTRGLMTDGDLKRAARASIKAIQARGVGARPGGLSIADDQGGRLSREEPGQGGLSKPARARVEDV